MNFFDRLLYESSMLFVEAAQVVRAFSLTLPES